MTTLYESEQRDRERQAETMQRLSEPDSCHWRIDGPPAEVSNTPEYQALVGQAIHEQVEASKWGMVEAVLIHAKQELEACANSYDGERRALLLGVAMGMEPAIVSADSMKCKHKVELERIKAEQKRIVNQGRS